MSDDKKGDFSDAIKATLKDGETLVTGTITRVIDEGDGGLPNVFFQPDGDIRFLHLEGHRISTGELRSTHDRGPHRNVPVQFDQKRIAFDCDAGDVKVGSRIALVHLDKQR